MLKCQTPSKTQTYGRTDGQIDASLRPSVRPSLRWSLTLIHRVRKSITVTMYGEKSTDNSCTLKTYVHGTYKGLRLASCLDDILTGRQTSGRRKKNYDFEI